MIAQRRLHTQRLIGPKFPTPVDVVAFFGAVQAQDFLPAMWALGMRTEGATEPIVEQAINDRQIVRTWPFRGTIHFVTPTDIRWMLALSAPRALKGNARLRELELDEAVFAQSRKVFSRVLADGRPQTRSALYRTLDEAGVSMAGQRGYHILYRHSLEGLICIGPREGKQQTFVLLDAWLPPGRELSREEALAELARRYFTSHGPATIKDFMWWCGLVAAEARAGLEMAKSQLAHEAIEGEVYWFDPAAVIADRVPSPIAHFLPFVDEYMVAYKDRDAVSPPEYNALVDSGNIIFHQPILIDGRVVGTWTRKLKKNSVVITMNLLRSLTPAEKDALGAAAKRFGAYLGLSAALE
ncbi:MAG TPA: winged helix DNA-binding domain-containing protein [Promineifilum sp.]|nr:winged helix DNA-binding domain-containing protein [Promineifilum sp.]